MVRRCDVFLIILRQNQKRYVFDMNRQTDPFLHLRISDIFRKGGKDAKSSGK